MSNIFVSMLHCSDTFEVATVEVQIIVFSTWVAICS